MKARNWREEFTLSKLAVDYLGNLVFGLSVSIGLAVFGALKAIEIVWGWALVTSLGIASAAWCLLMLRRQAKQAMPPAVLARIRELARDGKNISSRESANEWASCVYSGLLGLGMQLAATEFDDAYGHIVNKKTENETALRVAKQAVAWLRGLETRLSVLPPTDNSHRVREYNWVFQEALSKARLVTTKKQAANFWKLLQDSFYARGIPHLLKDVRPAMIAIEKDESADVSAEMGRIISILESHLKVSEFAMGSGMSLASSESNEKSSGDDGQQNLSALSE